MKMKYEILLNDIERECLRRIGGFDLPLISPLPKIPPWERYFGEGFVKAEDIVPEPQKHREVREELEAEQKRDHNELVALLQKYPIPSPKEFFECEVRYKREETSDDRERRVPELPLTLTNSYRRYYEAIAQIMKPEDFKRFLELREGGYLKNLENVREKHYNRSKKILRRLYGIIGIIQCHCQYVPHKYYYSQYVLPGENWQATQNAIETGIFSKEVGGDELSLLEYILYRTRNIKREKTRGLSPRFSSLQLSRENKEKLETTRASLMKLTGILCHVYGPEYSVYNLDGNPIAYFHDRWFLPYRNCEFAEKLINE